jgi:beta-mannosidase
MTLYNEILLNGDWELRDEVLSLGLDQAARLSCQEDGWITTPVPGDIHQGLMAAGRIKEPLVGLNSFDCAWTEKRSWWFRRTFEYQPERQDADRVELELNGLDSNAEIFLNGQHIGSHRSAFRPFIKDIKTSLQSGANVLLVRLTTGVETVCEADVEVDGIRPSTEEGNGRPERGDMRRILVRKPQYSFGWDWSPRLATTAIGGDVLLRAMRRACIRQIALRPTQDAHGTVSVAATVTIDQLHFFKSDEGTLTVTLTDAYGNQDSAQAHSLLRSGLTYITLTLTLADPQFWWPNGLGEQHLYRVEAALVFADGTHMVYPAFDFGLRFVELLTDGTFAFCINGKKIFCKGGDWIPADALYARISDERYATLVQQAQAANFNMLRIWGGGLYEREAFYQACDRCGIMLWHDFMFACAPYPDHLDWFRQEVEMEADYQTQRLQHHASLVLWCGNNENTWGFDEWWHSQTQAGALIYNYILPAAVQRNSPEIPYWNSSPYGGAHPNGPDVGDRHHWFDCMMNPQMIKRITPEEYDQCTSLFISEFGYVGACSKETVLDYMGNTPLVETDRTWQHHTNTFEKHTVAAGIRKHYADPEKLDIDGYLLYSGLTQGLMYNYALDSMRANPRCSGSLFWMYADCWGEVGWTIIDYYLRRKVSWYFVRRTYTPLRLILRPAGEGNIRVILANDTIETASFEMEYGYISLDGSFSDLQWVNINAPGLQRTELLTFSRGGHPATQGLWVARTSRQSGIPAAIFRAVDFRQLETRDPRLESKLIPAVDWPAALRTPNLGMVVEVSARGYAHAVQIHLPEGVLAEDNYFDLLPGEIRRVEVHSRGTINSEQIGVSCLFQQPSDEK